MIDREHGELEERWLRLGFSRSARILIVAYVEKTENFVRIISARKAVGSEIKQYNSR